MNSRRLRYLLPAATATLAAGFTTWMLWAARLEPGFRNPAAEQWRQEKRIVDLHMHIEGTPERFERAVRIMDRSGIGVGVNLSGGVVTHKEGEKSEFEKVKELADSKYPGRFVSYMNLDY